MEFGEPPVLKNKNRCVCSLNYRINICIWNHLWTNASTSSWTKKHCCFHLLAVKQLIRDKLEKSSCDSLDTLGYKVQYLLAMLAVPTSTSRTTYFGKKMNELTFLKRACQSLLIRHHYLGAASGHFQDFLNGCQKGRPWTCSCAALCVVTDLLCGKLHEILNIIPCWIIVLQSV